jgi:hypothetical protein
MSTHSTAAATSLCERTLRDAGFTDVSVARVPQVWRFDPPADPFDAVYNGGVRIRAMLRAQTREAFGAAPRSPKPRWHQCGRCATARRGVQSTWPPMAS